MQRLGEEFRTPGHIPVCREAKGGLSVRQGHTELAVGLARLAGTAPVVIGAEMLQPDGDLALPVADASLGGGQRYPVPRGGGRRGGVGRLNPPSSS